MQNNNSRIYFANLDALRFIAASLVVIYHIEHKKTFYGLDNLLDIYFFRTIGDIAVTIFFVLSGFIITYLLLTENAKTNTISIPKFYMRRVLRIWPLYYLVIFIGFFILPNLSVFYIPEASSLWSYLNWQTLLLYIFFLPNVVFAMYHNMPYMDQAWSIGVEEQFYILWPILLKTFRKSMPFFLLFIVVTILLTNKYFTNIFFNFSPIENAHTIKTFLSHERFSCMGIGGLGAYILFSFEKFTTLSNFLFKKQVQLFTLVVTAITLVYGVNKWILFTAICGYGLLWMLRERRKYMNLVLILCTSAVLYWVLMTDIVVSSFLKYFTHEILSVMFCIIIINLAHANTSVVNIRNKTVLYLGKISYGIYMYHNIFVVLSIYLFTKLMPVAAYNLPVYLSTFTLTIVASAISYELYEKFFLKLKKKKYTIVNSGTAA